MALGIPRNHATKMKIAQRYISSRRTVVRALGVAALLVALSACEPSDARSNDLRGSAQTEAPLAVAPADRNRLSMLIDGVEWRFETEVFGAFHPVGYNQALLISGTQGRKDANEKTFNINLYGIAGPGTYRVRSGNVDGNVAQIGNLNRDEFLAGNMMPFDLTVVVEQAQASPTRIRASFSGSIETNTERRLQIEQGVFEYSE